MLDSITKSIAKLVILKYGTPLCLWNQDQKSKLNQETILVAQGVMEKFLKVFHTIDFMEIFSKMYFLKNCQSFNYFSIFEAEKMACRSGWYHKLCFSCKICKRLMDYSNFVDYKVWFFLLLS